MAWEPIIVGSAPNDHTGTPLRTAWQRVNSFNAEQEALQSRVVSAADIRFANQPTAEAKITAAIAQAVLELATAVYVPAFMIPYDASLVTFSSSVKMIREGGDASVFDAFAYGARFDGVRDNWNNLKAVADALRVAGGTAYLPQGTCISSGRVFWPQGSIIRGAGRGVTIVKRKSGSITNGMTDLTGGLFWSGPTDGTLYTVGSHGSKISVYDLTIDGNAAGNPGITDVDLACMGIRFHFMDDVHLSQVEVMNCLDSGIYLWGCRRSSNAFVSVHHNGLMSVPSARNGFHVTGPQDDATDRDAQDDHLFEGCESYNNTDEGFAIGRNGRITIKGCYVHHNGDMGIEGDSGTATSDTTNVPAGWIIEGNHVYANGTTGGAYPGHGIGLGNSNVQRVVVSGNVLEDNPGGGIVCAFTSGSLVEISNNIITNWGTNSASNHGINVGGVEKVIIQGNGLYGGSGTLSTGIVLQSQTVLRHVTIDHNQVFAAGGGGMSITGSATGVVDHNIVNGTVSAFTDGIIVNAGATDLNALEVSHNYVTGCVRYGILVKTSGVGNAANVRLRSNTSTANAFGFAFSEAGGGTILRLVMEDNDLWGNSSGTITGLTAGMIAKRRDNQLGFPSSTDSLRGTAVLVNGTVTVSNTEIQTGDTVLLSRLVGAGTTRGILTLGTITNQTSFVVRAEDLAGALSADDDSTVFYEIIH